MTTQLKLHNQNSEEDNKEESRKFWVRRRTYWITNSILLLTNEGKKHIIRSFSVSPTCVFIMNLVLD